MLSLTTPQMIDAYQSERRMEAADYRRAKRFATARRTRRTRRERKLGRPAYRLAQPAQQ